MSIKIGTLESGAAVAIDPAKLISTRMLIQANSGGGKSWMLRVLCERLGKATPLIVLDWEGEFASLREKLDVLLVGRGGEIPTAVATAGALATQILEIGVSAVIDLYDLNPQEKRAYVRRFLESLMAAPKRLWRPYLIIVDEAHSLVPEAGQAESADAVNALMSQGRKRQFCGILATQRLSKLHKDAAAEANNVLIGRCNLDLDQKRAGDVLGMGRAEYTGLRSLSEGQFYAFGPAFNFDGVQLIKSADVETTHGAKALKAFRPPEPSVRMRGVVDQLKDLAERSKTEVLDLDQAKATIKELRRELAAKAPVTDDKAVERAVAEARRSLTLSIAKFLPNFRSMAGAFLNRANAIEGLMAAVKADDESLLRSLDSFEALLKAETSASPAPKVILNEQHTTVVPKRPAPLSLGVDGLSGPETLAIGAFAWFAAIGIDQPTKEQLCFRLGWRPTSGHIKNILGSLRSKGLVQGLSLTKAGQDAAPMIEMSSLAEYHDSIRSFLDGPQTLVFNLLLERREMDKESICAALGWSSASGHIKNVIGALRSLGVVEKRSYALSAMVFPEGLM